jgi:hypothetical protein
MRCGGEQVFLIDDFNFLGKCAFFKNNYLIFVLYFFPLTIICASVSFCFNHQVFIFRGRMVLCLVSDKFAGKKKKN